MSSYRRQEAQRQNIQKGDKKTPPTRLEIRVRVHRHIYCRSHCAGWHETINWPTREDNLLCWADEACEAFSTSFTVCKSAPWSILSVLFVLTVKCSLTRRVLRAERLQTGLGRVCIWGIWSWQTCSCTCDWCVRAMSFHKKPKCLNIKIIQ